MPPTITGVPASSGWRRTSTLAKNASMSTCRTVHPSARPARATPPPPRRVERVFDCWEDRSGCAAPLHRARPARSRHHRNTAAPTRREERTETDMTTPPTEPDSGTPADRAAGAMSEDEYLGRDGGADSGADKGADGGAPLTESLSGGDGGADGGADGGPGSDTGAGDPTTEGEEDTRFA